MDKLWKKNHQLYKDLQKERKKNGYLVRQLRKLKRKLYERKRDNDTPESEDWETRDF